MHNKILFKFAEVYHFADYVLVTFTSFLKALRNLKWQAYGKPSYNIWPLSAHKGNTIAMAFCWWADGSMLLYDDWEVCMDTKLGHI